LEGLFRRDPNLLRDYWDREQARRDYNLALRDSEIKGKIDGIREGEIRGEIKGTIKTLSALVRDGLLTLRDAALRANVTEEQFAAQMSAAQ
ncbi:MAG: hypothetical protein IJ702_06115, partial [Fretibacterium sp.]|nr:hypothetical protein [Fretibacterium sp.]